MARCPFQSNWAYDGATAIFKTTDCIGASCQVWDSTNGRCGVLNSDTLIAQVGLLTTQTDILTVQSNSLTAQTALMTPDPDDPMNQLNNLMKEYMSEQDCDDNDKVYGEDFGISDPPNMIESLQLSPKWPNPACQITLAQYKNWLDSLYDPFGDGGACGSSGITVLSPVGGESWGNGEVHNILWQAFGISDTVRLYYSINGGGAWIEIDLSEPTVNGTYAWTIPNNPSANCLVRVRDQYDVGVYGQSPVIFTIT